MSRFSNGLKGLSVKELNVKLVELEREKMLLESKARNTEGSSKLIRNYPNTPELSPFGNIRKVRKQIAVVKTFLNFKLLGGF